MSALKAVGISVALGCLIVSTTWVEPVSAQSARAEAPAKRGAVRGSVRGASQRIGGYSYRYSDATIDFRDDQLSEDPSIDRRTSVFDGGFWFDAPTTAPSRDESPYP